MMIEKLSIIIPAFNEEATIYQVLLAVHQLNLINGIEKEIIVVNDCSRDLTEFVINKFMTDYSQSKIQYIKHEINRGKGAAIQTAIQHSTGSYLVIQDADLELNPGDLNLLLKPVIDGKADVVYGSRFLNKTKSSTQSKRSYYANKLLTALSNLCSGLNLTDMETCYKLMKTEFIKKIVLKEMRFGFEPEITAKLSKIKGVRFAEVPVSYENRTKAEGKKIGWKDGVRAITCIIRYNFFR
jgi:glycosyltransferase involved in cell wall biosynthesis